MGNRIGVACFWLIGGKDLNVTLGFSLFQASEVAAGSLAILLSSRFISPQQQKISFTSHLHVW
jgi:hypothetical protein